MGKQLTVMARKPSNWRDGALSGARWFIYHEFIGRWVFGLLATLRRDGIREELHEFYRTTPRLAENLLIGGAYVRGLMNYCI
jgi:hypothetical protein